MYNTSAYDVQAQASAIRSRTRGRIRRRSLLTCCDPDPSGEYRSQSAGGAAVVGCAVDVAPVAVAPAKEDEEVERPRLIIGLGNQPWRRRA